MWEEVELKGWEIEMNGKTVILKKFFKNKEKTSDNCYISIALHKNTPLEIRFNDAKIVPIGNIVFKLNEIPELLSLFEDTAIKFLNKNNQG